MVLHCFGCALAEMTSKGHASEANGLLELTSDFHLSFLVNIVYEYFALSDVFDLQTRSVKDVHNELQYRHRSCIASSTPEVCTTTVGFGY